MADKGIVERLRDWTTWVDKDPNKLVDLAWEAADRVEELEARVAVLTETPFRGLDYDPRSNVEPDPYTFDEYSKRARSGEDDWRTMLGAIGDAHCHDCAPCDYEGIRLAAHWAYGQVEIGTYERPGQELA